LRRRAGGVKTRSSSVRVKSRTIPATADSAQAQLTWLASLDSLGQFLSVPVRESSAFRALLNCRLRSGQSTMPGGQTSCLGALRSTPAPGGTDGTALAGRPAFFGETACQMAGDLVQ